MTRRSKSIATFAAGLMAFGGSFLGSTHQASGFGGDRFDVETIMSGGPYLNEFNALADIDGDGDLDVIATRIYQGVVWYENLGAGQFGPSKFVSESRIMGSLAGVDVDGDGDTDILGGTYAEALWLENLDGLGNFAPAKVIADRGESSPNRDLQLTYGDLDGDGDFDMVHLDRIQLQLRKNLNDGAGNFSESQLAEPAIDYHGELRSIELVDYEGDGDLDLLVSIWEFSSGEGRLELYENHDGDGNFSGAQTLSVLLKPITQTRTGDLDGDGDLDVLGLTIQPVPLVLFERLDAGELAAPVEIASSESSGSTTFEIVDLDGDLDLDILFVGGGSKVIENTDGAGTFEVAEQTSSRFNAGQFASVGDLDGDGLVDLVGCLSGAQVWHRNTGNIDNFAEPAFVSELKAYINSMFAADLNGDIAPDLCYAWSKGSAILFQSYDPVAGDFKAPRVVSSVVPGASLVAGGDLDGDGDTDILVLDSIGVSWFENTDGGGTFGPRNSVVDRADNFPNPWNLSPVDLDQDGDLDILASANGDFGGQSKTLIVWFENLDGAGNFGPPREAISYKWDRHPTLAHGDFDGDGLVDILESLSGKLSWYKNLGGGNFGPGQDLHTALYHHAFVRLVVSDLDKDGDDDIVIGERWSGNRVSWLENLDGEGTFSASVSIVEGERIGQISPPAPVPFVGDFDGDDDMDIFTLTGDLIYWYKNEGDEHFGPIHDYLTPGVRPSTEDPAKQVAVVLDLDGDGDTDIITAGDFLRLYRGTPSPVRLDYLVDEARESDLSAKIRFQLSGTLNKDLKLGYRTVDLPLIERTVAYTPREGTMLIPAGSTEGMIEIPLGEIDGILRHGSEFDLELSPVVVGEFQRELGLPRFLSIPVTDSDAEPVGPATTHVVSIQADAGAGSLRQAIEFAVDGDRIEFHSELSGRLIRLTGSPLVVRNNLVIDASALPDGITISADGLSRVMEIKAETTVMLDSLILRDGLAQKGANGIAPVGGLGGSPGTKGAPGGGILNKGDLTMARCTLVNNQAGEAGEGARAFRLTDAWMGTVDGDGGDGGGIYNSGYLNLLNTTLSANITGMASKTKSGNGGGIFNEGDLTLIHTTLFQNHVDRSYRWGKGRGVFCASGGNVMLENSIIASTGYNNVGDVDVVNEGHPIQTRGANFIGSISWAENVPGTVLRGNPLLYGSPFPHLPRPNSPLINAAKVLATSPPTDQRGVPRDASPDIGAVEFSVTAPETQTHLVTSVTDQGPGSLREVLSQSFPRDTILFSSDLSGEVITLNAPLLIDRDIVIDASDLASGLRMETSGSGRTIEVSSFSKVTLIGMEISKSPDPFASNGGIRNDGSLLLRNCIIRGNRSNNNNLEPGGGIANHGTLEMLGCTVADNTNMLGFGIPGAGRAGGGIYNEGVATLTNCTVVNNHAGDGFYLPPEPEFGWFPPTAEGGNGGGIFNEPGGIVTLVHTTVTGNSYGKGDGPYPDGSGGGIFGEGFILENSIVAGNLDDDNHAHSFAARGHNLTSGDPMLASLGDNGGPTPTMLPVPNSPAIGGGQQLPTTLGTDQRGFLRPSAFNPQVDLGSVEYSIVRDGPLIRSFLADKKRVSPNEPFQLSWDVVGADQLHLTPVGGSISPALDGTMVALPEGGTSVASLYSSDLLIPADAVWKYHDQNRALGNTWLRQDYDDGDWLEGPAEIGFGTGRFRTRLEGTDSSTVYFRKKFHVGNPNADAPLTLRLKVNDGAVIYLNRHEIRRENMPAGTIYHSTRATEAAAASREHEWKAYQLGAAGEFLLEGENTIAVRVHNESPESSDLAFNLELGYSAPLLIERRSEWKYDDHGIDLGTSWREPAFDDSGWSTGQGEIGFGEGDEKTQMTRNGQPTVYFRKTFEVTEDYIGRTFVLRLNRDDGAVVYLNGQEILRDNMPAGDITFETFAPEFEFEGELRYYDFLLEDIHTLLQPGTNTIAVSVHNHSLESSDISFDLELAYAPEVSPRQKLVLKASRGGVSTEATVTVEIDDPSRADGDNDGLADVWERQFFHNLSQGARNDADGDGFFNLSEYQAGSSPVAGNLRPSLEDLIRLETGTGNAHLSLGRPSYQGARAALQFSPDLKMESWMQIGEFYEVDGIWKFLDQNPDRANLKKRFYRAQLLPDLP